jgi:hypothetical protein
MANTIILKRSATPGKVPTTSQLALGEIAINTHDGLLYIKKDDGTPSVVQIGGVTSVNSQTGAVTLTSSDIAEGSNQYFTQARARSAISAGSGISYNSSTGVISTSQSLTASSTPTFAGLTLNGNVSLTGDIIPTQDNVYSLGSPTMQWKDVYVGPGSLYVNGVEVIHSTDQTMNFTADVDQNMRITTTGTGILQLGSNSTVVQMAGTLQIQSGKNITDSAGSSVGFGNSVNMNLNRIVAVGYPVNVADAATKKYVDDTVGAISQSSLTKGDSKIEIIDSGTGTVNVTVDGSTALSVTANGVVVAGNFTVNGTTQTVHSTVVNIADNILTLNSDVTGTPTQNAGLEINRGDSAKTKLLWNEGSGKWTFTNDGSTYYPIAVSTSDLAEGSNQYFTQARARGSLTSSSSTGISYNSTSGNFTLGSIPNSSLSNSTVTVNGNAISLGGSLTLSTDSIGEGSTNQYFTTSRARTSVSAGTGITYNSTTGVIGTSITQYTDAMARATLSAGTGISYNSTTGAISTSAIPNSSLSNSSLTVGTTSISLGSSSTTLAGLTSVTSTSFTGALTGNVTGNADTATSAGKWTTARTLTLAGDLSGSVSIDGSANVTLNATVVTDGVALGTDTTGNYVASITNGSYITGGNGGSEGAALTIAVDATTTNTASKVVARDASGNFSAGTITAALSGNASTASAWANARTITLAGDLTGSVSIDGSANATLTATVAANSVALGTDTTGNYMVDVAAGTGISVSHTQGEGSTATITNTGVTALNSLTGSRTLAHYHSAYQTVSAAEASTNATSAVTYTFSELSGSVHHIVLLNRMHLRPTEYGVSGTTLTIAAGFGLVEGDEIEVTGSKLS